MRKLLVITWFLLTLLSGCGGGGGGQNSSGGGSTPTQLSQLPQVSLVRLELVAASPLASGLSTDLQLFAVFSNGIRVDVTSQATFSSSSPSVTLTGSRATAAAVGLSTISGQFQGQTSSAQIQVIAASLTSLRIDPPQTTLAAGLTQQFRVFGTFSDNSTSELTSSVSWSVETPARAEFQDSPKGFLRALTAGDTRVIASLQGKTAQADLQVTSAVLQSLEVSPNPISLPIGIGQQFTATGVFSDGSHRMITEDASWSSGDTDIFLISDVTGSKGIGAGLKLGTANVTATYGAVSGSARITVIEAVLQSLTITPDNGSLAKGLELDFHASGHFSDGQNRDVTSQVVWSSSAPSVASISNLLGSTGRARGQSEGQANITAQLNGISQTTALTVGSAILQTIDVVGAQASLPAGLTRSLAATGHLSDGNTIDLTNQVVWSSSAGEVAVVDQSGLVTARRTGNTAITASKGALEGKATLMVSEALLQSLSIAPPNSQLPEGLTRQYTATGLYSDSTTQDLSNQVTWTSSNPQAASISNSSPGLARGLKLGTTVVKAEFNGLEDHTNLEVTTAVVVKVLVSPSRLAVPVGLSSLLKATAVFSDGNQRDVTDQVTWSSDDASVIDLNSSGRALGLKQGECRLRATLGSVQGELLGRVQNTVTSIEVLTGSTQVTSKSKTRFYALAQLSDGTYRDASADVVWSVQSSAAMSIAQGYDRGGELTVAGNGAAAQITANLGALQAQLSTSSAAASEGFTPRRQLDLAPDGSARLRLYTSSLGEYTGATWTTSNSSVATVGGDGLVTILGPGNATLVGGEFPTLLKTVRVHVPSSPFVSLELKVAGSEIPLGGQGSVRAEALTADGERIDVSDQATWSSSIPENALVFGGRIEARQTGSTVLTANYLKLSASASVTISGAAPPTMAQAQFVDSSLAAGGDGSQSNPYNNLAEALSHPAPVVFLFRGEGSGDGMQWAKPLPSPLELRGQKLGYESLGIAATSDYPQAALRVNPSSNNLLHGFSTLQLATMDFASAANVSLDHLVLGTGSINIGDVDGPCRILNSQVFYSQPSTGTNLISLTANDTSKVTSRDYEFGNLTVTADNLATGLITGRVGPQFGPDGLSEVHLNIHDNTVLSSFSSVPAGFGSLSLNASLTDLNIKNNRAGLFQLDLTCKSGSQIDISNNILRSGYTTTMELRDVAGTMRVANNQLDALSLNSALGGAFGFGAVQNQFSLRVDGNQISGSTNAFGSTAMSIVTDAAQLLVQSNTVELGSLNVQDPALQPTSRLIGLRDNQVSSGDFNANFGVNGSTCLAVTGNRANRFQLSGRSTLVVEGLSMLGALNTFSSLVVGSFTEAAADSCGIPR
ncbi:MAG: Ig-like domain-containing protein [Vulcanimicrobiota bacterium]